MQAMTTLVLILLSGFAGEHPALVAPNEENRAEDQAGAAASMAAIRNEKAALILENSEPIQFKASSGALDGTEIRRFGGNALRFRYNGNITTFDALNNDPFQIRNSAGASVFSVDPDSHAFFNNTGSLGIGRSPDPNVKLDILSSNGPGAGIRFLRSDAKDARIQLGDPSKTWSMAVGWATAGDFSIIEELVAGDRLYIKQGGNVGIGTTNPTERFEVLGSIKLSGNLVSSDSDLRIQNSATGSAVVLLANGDVCIGSGCP